MTCTYLEVLEHCQSIFPVSPAATRRGRDSEKVSNQENRVPAELCQLTVEGL